MKRFKKKKDRPVSVISLPLGRSDVTVSSELMGDHNMDMAHPLDSGDTVDLNELHQQVTPSCDSDVKVVKFDGSLERSRSATDIMELMNQEHYGKFEKFIDSQSSVIRTLMEKCNHLEAETVQLEAKKHECDQLRQERDSMRIECDNYMKKYDELREMVDPLIKKCSTLEDYARKKDRETDRLDGDIIRLSEEVMQLKSCDELDPYVLTDVEPVEDSNFKEGGSYGSVSLVRINSGVKCIEKRLLDILVGYGENEKVSEEQKKSITEKFRKECIFLSQMRHPNIVQFMGVRYSQSNCLSLIMEFLPMSVHICIKRCNSSDIVIPLCFKLSILRDVSYGLLHLHGLSMIHRDLSAGNVLLTSDLRAKIADFGVSKYLTQTELIKLTKAPGAGYIMPPEALDEQCQYSEKFDVFSFGILSLELMLQKCPSLSNKGITAERADNKEIEIGRRIDSIEKVFRICHDTKFKSVICACLQDLPEKRWPITELKDAFEYLCQKYPSKREYIIQKLQRLEQELRP